MLHPGFRDYQSRFHDQRGGVEQGRFPHRRAESSEQIITKAKAGMSITESSNLTISFQGDKQLGFAFSCLVATLGQDGKIRTLEPGGDVPLLESAPHNGPDTVICTRRIMCCSLATRPGCQSISRSSLPNNRGACR